MAPRCIGVKFSPTYFQTDLGFLEHDGVNLVTTPSKEGHPRLSSAIPRPGGEGNTGHSHVKRPV